MKIKFILFILILAIPFVTIAKKDKEDSKTQKIPKYDTIQKELTSQSLANLARLRGQIKSSYIKDATKLAKAIIHLEKKHYDAAYSLLRKISNRSILIDYIKYYRALTLLEKKQYKKALSQLPILKQPSKKIELEQFWLRINLLALTNSNNKEKMKTEIGELKKKRSKDKWMDIKGGYYKGLAEFTTGSKQTAYSYFRSVLVKNPGTEYDQKIFDLLKSNNISINKILSEAQWNLRAEKLISSGFPHEAVKIYEGFYKKNKSYEERVAYATFRARDYKNAAARYEEVLKSGNHKASEVSIMLKLAKSYARHDNFDNALKYYQKILNKYPKTSQARLANFKLGFTYFDAGQYEKAARYFEKFLTKGSRWQKDRARWFRLWSFYLTKQYDRALAEMDAWEKQNGKRTRDKIPLYYWKARIAEKLKQKKLARSLYQKVVRLDGLDYYGLLSRQRLAGIKLHQETVIHPKSLSMVPNGKSKKVKADINLKSLAPNDPLIKAILLAQIGLDNFAFNETRHSSHTKMVPDFHISKAIEKAGNHNRGYAVRNHAINGRMVGSNRLEGFRLGFPQAYNKFVKPYSELWNIDENLAYAVMRQESAFKPEALSYAYAYGLMQIIPPHR